MKIESSTIEPIQEIQSYPSFTQKRAENRISKKQHPQIFVFNPNQIGLNRYSSFSKKQNMKIHIDNYEKKIKRAQKQKEKMLKLVDNEPIKAINVSSLLNSFNQQAKQQPQVKLSKKYNGMNQKIQELKSQKQNKIVRDLSAKIIGFNSENLQDMRKLNPNSSQANLMKVSSNLFKLQSSQKLQYFIVSKSPQKDQPQIINRKRDHKSSFKLEKILQPNRLINRKQQMCIYKFNQKPKKQIREDQSKRNTQKAKQINYDSFFFVDNITNQKILLKQISHSYGKKQKSSQTTQIKYLDKQNYCNNQENQQIRFKRLGNSNLQNKRVESQVESINSVQNKQNINEDSCKMNLQSNEKRNNQWLRNNGRGLKMREDMLNQSMQMGQKGVKSNRFSKNENLRSTFEQSVRAKTSQLNRNKKESQRKDRRQSTCKPKGIVRATKKQKTEEAQMKQINACLSLMKNTKLFQLDSLRQKIFKGSATVWPQNQTKSDQIPTQMLFKQKKQLKRVIDQTIRHFERKELTQFLSSQKNSINSKIMGLHKSIPNKINKHNVAKAIQQILENIELKLPKKQQNKRVIDISDVRFQGQSVFKMQMLEYLHKSLKKSQFLIQTKKSDRLGKMIIKSFGNRGLAESAMDRQQQVERGQQCDNQQMVRQIRQLIFDKKEESEKIRVLKGLAKRPVKKMKGVQQRMIKVVRQGFLFDLQTELLSHPKLVNLKDQQGNSLLHIAAKHNQIQIFEFLIKTCGIQMLKQQNDFGKTVIDIARLFGANQILQKCNQSIRMVSLFSLTLQQKVDPKNLQTDKKNLLENSSEIFGTKYVGQQSTQ